MCADEEGLFLAVGNECWKLDGNSGDLVRRYRIDEPGQEWGAVFRYKNLLVGSVVPKGSHYLNFLGSAYWYNDESGLRTDKVCSKSLFALDPGTGEMLWGYTNGVVVEATLCMGGDRIYFVECRNASVVAGGGGRIGDSLWQDLHLVALDADSGAVVWEKPISPAKGTTVVYMMYAPNDDRLVFLTSGKNYQMYTYSAGNGAEGWATSETWYPDDHSGFMLRPVVVGDRVFLVPRLYNLSDGTVLRSNIGNSRGGCPTYSASSGALIYRETDRKMAMQDLDTGKVSSWNYLRPSCWLNFTPSGGLFLMPEGAGGCSCNGWINTSLGFTDKE
jgi:outer membrane protein assembly factor BamB